MNGISAWAIRHPLPTILLFLVLSLSGVVGFGQLRINDMPDIHIPTVTVSVSRSGAAPAEMETEITRLVEDSVAGLGNVQHIRSTVTEGLSATTVEFTLGTDVDRAMEDVRNAVAAIRRTLPADSEEPQVQRVEDTGQPILTFIIEAPHMAPDALSRFVDDHVAKAVLTVAGVARIERAGGVVPEIRVALDPDRLMALGITAAEVSDQLKAQNVDLPGGRATLGSGEQAIRTRGSAADLQALARQRLILSGGRTVALSELGAIEMSWAEPRQRARYDNREVVGFNIYRAQGTGEVRVTREVRETLAAFAARQSGMTIREVTTSTDDVLAGYAAAIEALVIGAALAVVVVWFFLRDLRATLTSSLALPLSLLPTFGVMALLNQSLNNITLLGIALVVGILVDDAIVEIENIVRHMRQSGRTAYEAAMEAADEIGLAVVATTFSIIAVFMPVGFMPGFAGQIFKAFAIAVCTSVFFSLVVARLLTPLMGAFLMKPHVGQEEEARWIPAYLRILRWTLRWRWLTLIAGVAFFAGSVMLAGTLPTDFMPASDRGRSVLSIELAPGSTLADTDAAVRQVTDALKSRPEVLSVYAALGSPVAAGPGQGDATAGEVRKALLTVNLRPRGERALTQQEFEVDMAARLADVPGARMRFGADGQSGARVEVSLRGDDPVLLAQAAVAVTRDMQGTSGFHNAASTTSLSHPELRLLPVPDRVALLGLSTEAIARTASIATVGEIDRDMPRFNLVDRQIPIRVMLDDDARSDLSRILSLQLPTPAGTVPLASVAELALSAGPSQIDRLDRSRSATIEAELVRLTTGQAEAIVSALPSIRHLPPGVTRQAAGDGEHMEELLAGFTLAIGSGVLLLFLCIALLFNNILQPVTILTALPLSLGGAFGLMAVTGTSVSLPALIGILMLMGIAAKNSILLVEYAITARSEAGLDREDALIDAARKRARPIVMTTVAMGAGMLPLALGIGADAEFRSAMAIAVIGGLLSSTVLSLVYVPAVFTVMDDLDRWARRVFRPLMAGQRPASAG